MNYKKYYKEIKNRSILLVLNWSLLLVTCYSYKEILLFTLIDLSNYLNTYFIFTNVSEVFQIYLDLTLFISTQISLFVILYHGMIFFTLGLHKNELFRLKIVFKFFTLIWLGSIIILFKCIIPFSWAFFLSFQQSSYITQPISLIFEAKLEDYFNHIRTLYNICLINCQFLALLIFFLLNFSQKFKQIKTFRKLFYLIFVIFSTIITPPDIISQIIISLLLILVYEFLIFYHNLKTNMVTN